MRFGLPAVAVVVVLALGSPAIAATVTLEYEEPVPGLEPEPAYALTLVAAAGERNGLSISRDTGGWTVQDDSAPLTPGDGCAAVSASEVRCGTTKPARHYSAFVRMGDGGDRLRMGALQGGEVVEIEAGSGDDLVVGSAGRDLVAGGSGRDWLLGLSGGDRIDGGRGDDRLDGGAGDDTAEYSDRRQAVSADLAAGRGGAEGENDSLVEIENLAGGRGADRLWGDSGPNLLFGGNGRAADVADGRAGDDVVSARRAIGSAGDDILDGQSVSCGSGSDEAARARFMPSGAYGRNCERINAAFYELSQPRRGRGERAVRFTFSCPIGTCRGVLELRAGDERLGLARYSVRGSKFGGRSETVLVPLARRPSGRTLRLRVLADGLRDGFRVRLPPR